MNLSLRRHAALLSLTVAALMGSSLVHAADGNNAGNAAVADCSKANTQGDMEQCATQALNKADAELNQTYVQYRNRLDKAHQNQIRDVQLAWIKYRDLSCKYASSDTGGSAHGLALQTCLTDKTLERTRELKALATCPEGDITCPR